MTASLTDQVRQRYALAAREVISREFNQLNVLGACCGSDQDGACCSTGLDDHSAEPATPFGASHYPPGVLDSLPALAVAASSGCGNPTAFAGLQPGEIVVDLGCGSGVDALLAARLVGPEGRVHGIDMTGEMVALASSAARSAGAANTQFVTAEMHEVPLPDAGADVVMSNCALNLAEDKVAVLREMARLLRPGGRVAACDVVASDWLTPEDRAARGSYLDCIAGAWSFGELTGGLDRAGFVDVRVDPTGTVADEMFAARITARRPS